MASANYNFLSSKLAKYKSNSSGKPVKPMDYDIRMDYVNILSVNFSQDTISLNDYLENYGESINHVKCRHINDIKLVFHKNAENLMDIFVIGFFGKEECMDDENYFHAPFYPALDVVDYGKNLPYVSVNNRRLHLIYMLLVAISKYTAEDPFQYFGSLGGLPIQTVIDQIKRDLKINNIYIPVIIYESTDNAPDYMSGIGESCSDDKKTKTWEDVLKKRYLKQFLFRQSKTKVLDWSKYGMDIIPYILSRSEHITGKMYKERPINTKKSPRSDNIFFKSGRSITDINSIYKKYQHMLNWIFKKEIIYEENSICAKTDPSLDTLDRCKCLKIPSSLPPFLGRAPSVQNRLEEVIENRPDGTPVPARSGSTRITRYNALAAEANNVNVFQNVNSIAPLKSAVVESATGLAPLGKGLARNKNHEKILWGEEYEDQGWMGGRRTRKTKFIKTKRLNKSRKRN